MKFWDPVMAHHVVGEGILYLTRNREVYTRESFKALHMLAIQGYGFDLTGWAAESRDHGRPKTTRACKWKHEEEEAKAFKDAINNSQRKEAGI